jgi:thioredoxin-dependent peroxiredoxin
MLCSTAPRTRVMTTMREAALIAGLVLVIGLGYSWLNTARAAQPAVGEAAPAFRLQDQNGNWVALDDFKGKWIAVYFYPKADTPGCTKEACEFRDNIFAFEEIGATVIGISIDAIKDQKKFATKYSLPFPLLADIDGRTAEAYGVLNNLGIMKIAKRQSFLIGPDGRIARHYAKVDPSTHSKEVLADLKALGAKDQDPEKTG